MIIAADADEIEARYCISCEGAVIFRYGSWWESFLKSICLGASNKNIILGTPPGSVAACNIVAAYLQRYITELDKKHKWKYFSEIFFFYIFSLFSAEFSMRKIYVILLGRYPSPSSRYSKVSFRSDKTKANAANTWWESFLFTLHTNWTKSTWKVPNKSAITYEFVLFFFIFFYWQ